MADGHEAELDRSRRRVLQGLAAAAGTVAFGVEAAAPQPRATVRHWDATTDLLVVGSGAGGMSAAIEAQRGGLEVLVLEKFQIPGGSSSISGGVCYLGGGTALQKALGFTDTVDDMYRYMMAASGLYADEPKIRLYCEHSVAHFDWLVAQGVRYAAKFSEEKEISIPDGSLYYCGSEQVHPYRELARPAPRGHVPPSPHLIGGRDLMQALIASAEAAGVKLRLRASAERLIVENDGRIAGAVVEQGGQRIHVRARRGVVLAAGGFIHNRVMVQRFAPELAQCSVPWGRAGDLGQGILMGVAVGGATLRMHHGFVVIPMYPPESILGGILVNARGQRFVPEDGYYGLIGHEIAFRQDGKAWMIADRTQAYAWKDFRLNVAAQAPTIAELEGKLALPEGTLLQTVDYYNRHAEQGRDPLLHKAKKYLAPLRQEPFTAYDLSLQNVFAPVHTFGGLQTNLDGQVINAWGEAIPGLYAVGRTSAGLPVAPYIGSGVSIGDATFFGRRAGVHAGRAKA